MLLILQQEARCRLFRRGYILHFNEQNAKTNRIANLYDSAKHFLIKINDSEIKMIYEALPEMNAALEN